MFQVAPHTRTLLDTFMSLDQFNLVAASDAPIVTVLAVTAVIARAVIVPHAVLGQNHNQSPIAHPVVSATFRTVSADQTAVVKVVSTVFEDHQKRTQNHVVVSLVRIPHLLLAGAAELFIMSVAVYATGIGSDSVP